MVGYTQITQAGLSQEISVSLQDPLHTYWKVDEINRTINEALLLWGGLTSYWRERGAFSCTTGVPFYDVHSYLPLLRARTYTLDQLTAEIQYHLIEPPNGISGAGMTEQFSIDQILAALKRHRNQFVLDSRLPFSVTGGALTWDQATFTWDQEVRTWDQLAGLSIPISPPPDGRVPLPQFVALIGRATWTDANTTTTTPLRREDPWAMQSTHHLWPLDPGTPIAYSQSETRPIELQFFPPPLSSGSLGLLFVPTIDMDITDPAALFSVPDEFVSAIKWATLYELLSTDSEGYDPIRAQYCLERYNQIIAATALHRSILRVSLNSIPLALDTLQSLDAARPYWQTQSARPDMAACAYDMLALASVPNNIYGLTLDLVRSAPLPFSPTSFIQVGREDIPYIMDYCRHALSFKLGGEEFVSTMPLYDNFLRGARQRNKLLSAVTRYLAPLFGVPQKEESVVPAA